MKIKAWGLTLFIFASVMDIQAWAAGEPAVFLTGGVGARALGMGSAYTALADDASSVYWNPAQLGWQENFEVTAMYADLGLDSVYNYTGMILPISFASLGGGWIHQSTTNIEQTNNLGKSLGETDTANDAFLIGYGQPLGEVLSFGFTAKIIHQKISSFSASGLGVDLGFLLNFEPMRVAINVQNLNSPELKGDSYWDSNQKITETIPRKFKVGLAYKTERIFKIGQAVSTRNRQTFPDSNVTEWTPQPPENQQEIATGEVSENKNTARFSLPLEINWALDISLTPNSTQNIALAPGMECWFNRKYALRAGWNGNDFNHAHAFYHNLSFGASAIFGFLELDYAYVIHEDLDNTHRFSTSFLF